MIALVVDDEPAVIAVIEQKVNWEKLGVKRCITVSDAMHAMKIIEEENPEIIISDIEMPQMTGLDLLEWYRKGNYSGEFLFLTSHERFDYAAQALHLGASEYLLKPFDVAIMEGALKKLIHKIMEKRSSEELTDKIMQKEFFKLLFEEHSKEELDKLRDRMDTPFLADEGYTLVISKLANIDGDREKVHTSLLKFMLENIHSEVLNDTIDSTLVKCFDMGSYCNVVAVCSDSQSELKVKCDRLLLELKKLFSGTATCIICEPCPVDAFFGKYQSATWILNNYISGSGTAFFEEEATEISEKDVLLLDENTIAAYLTKKDKIGFMMYLRETVNNRMQTRPLNVHEISLMNQQIMQAVYAYLANKNISATELFADEELAPLAIKSAMSVTDMIKWANYFFERALLCVESQKEGQSFVEKINQFVAAHYSEDIGRNEIAAEFFLNPEYLSKIYKKQTGVSLKDYINEYRINQSKKLLADEELRISEVASMVGFDNFTYFSTTFKKYTGITPNQFRKNEIPS